MIKTITEYQELAKRTCPTLGSHAEDLVHMKLGVFTEIGELLDVIKKHLAYGKAMDVVNIGEEIADVVWYIVNNSTFRGYTIHHIPPEFASIISIPNVIDYCERIMCCYILDGDDERIESYGGHNQVAILKSIADYFELNFLQILTNNINKLKVRYPDKFDTEKAINRNLDRERIELEK